MTNIWGFLLQTLSVSGVALLLLVIKRLLRDKVSPDVQYVFWLALMVRIVLPVRAGESILFSFPVLVEMLKAKVERGLFSAYSGMYELAGNAHILPVYGSSPQSVTDWLFVAYGIGIVAVLLGYAFAYFCLRIAIVRADEDETEQARVEQVAARYGLHTVRVRRTARIRTPFVCGVVCPVLMLPQGQEVDELVILHELLHREHHDPARNLCWCLLRALHWCNPFVWYVINRIENDLETCNDKRVLERIEGEARRAYGKTLLAMATSRYARMPGTSSVSNGRKNIRRRVEAIVRFKKYPEGMTFVLVCIAIILGSAAVQSQASVTGSSWQRPAREEQLDYALAKSRVERCTTMAGALDTYAKGVLYKNGIYLAMASPLSGQALLDKKMREGTKETASYADFYLDGLAGEGACEADSYCICNVRADGRFGQTDPEHCEAVLLFGVVPAEGSSAETEAEDELPRAADTVTGAVLPEDGQDTVRKTLAIPVKAYRTVREGWVVEQTGGAQLFDASPDCAWVDISRIRPLQSYEAKSAYGRVTLDAFSRCMVEGATADRGLVFLKEVNKEELHPDAGFEYTCAEFLLAYDVCGAQMGAPKKKIGIVCARIPEGETVPAYPGPEHCEVQMRAGLGGGSSDDYVWELQSYTGDVLEAGFGGGMDMGEAGVFDPDFGARLYWDGEQVDEVLLEKQEDAYGER